MPAPWSSLQQKFTYRNLCSQCTTSEGTPSPNILIWLHPPQCRSSLRESDSLDPQIYRRVILGLIIPGLGLTTALLALYGYAAWKVVSRRYLDRVSFRLLTYALVAHLVFGVSFTMATVAGYPGWRCSLSSFLTNSSIMFSGWMFFCIALNIPLVVMQNINGQAMEKYYVAGATLICLICNVPPYASGNLGHSVLLTSWIMIITVGEVGAFPIILELHLLRRCAHTEMTYSTGAGSTILKFRHIILRIGLYPLVSCMFNITAVVINLHDSQKYKREAPESTKLPDMILMFADLAVTAGRPLIYDLLAATNPSFIRALSALRHPEAESQTQFYGRSYCLSTIVDISPLETSSYDSEALHNDYAQSECMRAPRESSAAPERDLGMGKAWRPYLTAADPAND
ncbi:hypothetical protein B0H14DRAFT_3524178 [Mycena olivaceomarginata]|nr:hypothetical protein B0H14DRAFT_3524178 [Mycena olivaceomarginata]